MTQTKRQQTLVALHINLRRLLAIRAIVFFTQLTALLYAWQVLEFALPYAILGGLLCVFLCLNLVLLWRILAASEVTETEFLGHLLLDILFLSAFLYFSGGASNPFVSYLLVPVTIAAATLKRSFTWIVTFACLLAYSLLLVYYRPLPALMPAETHGEHGTPALSGNLHIIGMWLNFLVSAGLITWFVVRMAAELRQQEQQLSVFREANLRDEQILAIATQAAATAHELGTPLSSMSVVLNDLQPGTTLRAEELEVLRSQLRRCQSNLRQLVTDAEPDVGQQRRVSLLVFVEQILEQWQLLRPQAGVQLQNHLGEHNPDILQDSGLQQAIVNFMNNAADACETGLELSLSGDGEHWQLNIRDHGPGLSESQRQGLGRRLFSTKREGLGMGYLLSSATIERLGGSVSLISHADGGTVTSVRMPLGEV